MRSRSHFSYEQAATAKWLVQTKHMYQHEAAAMVGCNQGRVSETLSGKRYPSAPAANLLKIDIH